MTLAAAECKTPVYIRLAREATKIITGDDYSFHPGKVNYLRTGDDGFIISHSVIGSEVAKAVELVSGKGISLTHVNFGTIKPLDNDFLAQVSTSNKPIIVVEEHLLAGSLTSIIATWSALNKPIKIHSTNLNDSFGESGSPDDLYSKYGFSAEKIAAFIQTIFQ